MRRFRLTLHLPKLLVATIILGLATTAAMILWAWTVVLNEEQEVLGYESGLINDIVAQRVHTSDEAAHRMAALFWSSTEVDADQFRIFSQEILPRHLFISSISYLPKVTAEDKHEFIRTMRNQGYVTFGR